MRSCFELSNGVQMPKIGFGTYKSTDGSDECVISQALEAGYRLLDTAAAYKNEEQVGKAITRSGISRKEIFLTSKVWKTDLGYENTKKSFQESLERLQTDYLDLFLLHWPKPDPEFADWKELDRESLFVLVGICTGGDRVPEVRVAQLQNLVQLLVGKADQVIVAGGIELGNGSGADRGN